MQVFRSVCLALVFLLIALRFAGWWQSHGPSSRYLIPSGYVGIIRIEYEIRGAPALTMEEGRYLMRLSFDGKMQTSSSLDERGHAAEDFYYVSGAGRQRLPVKDDPFPVDTLPPPPMVRGGRVGSGTNMPVTEEWFIGTDKQFDDYVKKHPDYW